MITGKQISELLTQVRMKRPLVHHITNYVTVNDCANITIAAGAAPVMADAPEEVCEMVTYAGALVLNIGTLDKSQIAGATCFRTQSAQRLLDELKITILKGNAGEIGTLAGAEAHVKGVDSHGVTGDLEKIVKKYAKRAGMTVVVSGATDIVTDGRRIVLVGNGHPMMGGISGTGCMAASITGVFASVTDDPVIASSAALAAFGIAGEKSAVYARGPGSFKTALFDEMAALKPGDLASGARIRFR
jgi:hydroxyethylthiazole kinase